MGESFELKPPSNTGGSDDNVLIPDQTVVDAVVLKVETKTKPYNDDHGEPVKKVVFRFSVTTPEYFENNVWGETSTSFVNHEKCRLRSWIGEILGVTDLPEGFSFNTDDLIEADCRILVEQYSYTKNDKLEKRNRVIDVMRAATPASVGAGYGDSNSGYGDSNFGEEPF